MMSGGARPVPKHGEASEGCGFYTLLMAVATLSGRECWVFAWSAFIIAALMLVNRPFLMDGKRLGYANFGFGNILR